MTTSPSRTAPCPGRQHAQQTVPTLRPFPLSRWTSSFLSRIFLRDGLRSRRNPAYWTRRLRCKPVRMQIPGNPNRKRSSQLGMGHQIASRGCRINLSLRHTRLGRNRRVSTASSGDVESWLDSLPPWSLSPLPGGSCCVRFVVESLVAALVDVVLSACMHPWKCVCIDIPEALRAMASEAFVASGTREIGRSQGGLRSCQWQRDLHVSQATVTDHREPSKSALSFSPRDVGVRRNPSSYRSHSQDSSTSADRSTGKVCWNRDRDYSMPPSRTLIGPQPCQGSRSEYGRNFRLSPQSGRFWRPSKYDRSE